jgi:NitT/TauT family transport system ATP-binding protein
VTESAHRTVLSLAHVRREFAGGRIALADVSLDIANGEFVSLLGASGCGKSTVLRLLGVGLADSADAVPRELSGGMKMRASMARALVTSPRVWLLDEPFGALDEITRFALNQTLLSLCKPSDGGKPATAVFVTHSVYEAVFLSERVVVMGRPGRIVGEVAIDAPYPRDAAFRATPRFAALCAQVSDALQRASVAEAGA